MGSPPRPGGGRTRRAGRAGGARSGDPGPRGSPTQRPGTRGKRKRGARAPGQPRAGLTWLAGGGRPPSRGRGALTACCLSPAEHPRRAGPCFPFFASVPDSRGASGAGRGRGAQGPAGGGGLREDTRPRARAARAAPALRRRLGRSAGAARGGRGSQAEEPSVCLWQAGLQRLLPSAARPSSRLSLPRGRRGPGADAARAAEAGSLARGGEGAAWAGVPSHLTPSAGGFLRPLGPRAPLLSSHPSLLQRGDGGRQTEKWGESCWSSGVLPGGTRGRRVLGAETRLLQLLS